MKLYGPFEIKMKLSVTNDEGMQGVATIGLGKGQYPTPEAIQDAISRFENESMPEGFRLMNKREWWDTVLPPHYDEDEDGERHAIRYAHPGGDDWDVMPEIA
jgi:hypothetical protein